MVTLNSGFQVPSDVLFREIGGEAVILNVATGKYYGLNEMGTRMWAALIEKGSLEAACQALLEEYEVDETILQADLLHLVEGLVEKGC
jgi:hypothetical protein